jgi:hypothetical protein
VLKEICFTAAYPTGTTQLDIVGAVFCHIRNTGCQIPSPYGFTVPNNGIYCWELALPKCTERQLNCIVACDECKYCTFGLRWERINGVCRLLTTNTCNDGTCQGSTCDETQEACPGPVCCQ